MPQWAEDKRLGLLDYDPGAPPSEQEVITEVAEGLARALRDVSSAHGVAGLAWGLEDPRTRILGDAEKVVFIASKYLEREVKKGTQMDPVALHAAELDHKMDELSDELADPVIAHAVEIGEKFAGSNYVTRLLIARVIAKLATSMSIDFQAMAAREVADAERNSNG